MALYKPAGKGPFPAVLYNHGGSPGLLSNIAFDAIAPHFVERGWVFFAPYRRGQGLSAQANRIAVMGNSVGGIQTVLGAERRAYCAAVDLTGGAMSWGDHPTLRKVMTEAVEHSKAPILFVQAANDYTTEPSKVLYAAARRAHRDAQIHIYPPFHGGGKGGMQGHSIAWLGVSEWWPEAFGFINDHCSE